VRASFEGLRPWEIGDVELEADREVYLNFVLMSAAAPALPDATADAREPADAQQPAGFWSRPVPNPVLATVRGRPVTLRALSIVLAVISFPLGAFTMLMLGRRFGIETRSLSAHEVGDLVMNPIRPNVGERVTPVATVGARGASANVSYGADEITAALAQGRYGLVLSALVIAPGLFAIFASAMAIAMIIGHETYLLVAMMLVPLGFVLTAIIIGVQAVRRTATAP
jgi:hypothetical protein